MLCQAYLQNQCAGNSCSVRAHVCAMVVRDSGHVFGTKHPACKHRWDKKAAEQESRRNSRENRHRWSSAVGMDDNCQPAVGQKQAAVAEQYLDYLDSLCQSGSYSRHHGPSGTVPTRTASAPRPPQATGGSGTGATHDTVVLDTPSGTWQDLLTKLGNNTELGEHEESEQEATPITTDGYLGALWTYILGLARAGVGEVQRGPKQVKPTNRRCITMCRSPWM